MTYSGTPAIVRRDGDVTGTGVALGRGHPEAVTDAHHGTLDADDALLRAVRSRHCSRSPSRWISPQTVEACTMRE